MTSIHETEAVDIWVKMRSSRSRSQNRGRKANNQVISSDYGSEISGNMVEKRKLVIAQDEES
jgi:hypothetical protein